MSALVATLPLVRPTSTPRLETDAIPARRNTTSPGRRKTKTTRSPPVTPSLRRTATGMVTWPLLVILVVSSMRLTFDCKVRTCNNQFRASQVGPANEPAIRRPTGEPHGLRSPQLLGELKASTEPLIRKLDPAKAKGAEMEKVSFDEKGFRFAFNEDAMATEKTAEGIRVFAADIVKLEQLIKSKRG